MKFIKLNDGYTRINPDAIASLEISGEDDSAKLGVNMVGGRTYMVNSASEARRVLAELEDAEVHQPAVHARPVERIIPAPVHDVLKTSAAIAPFAAPAPEPKPEDKPVVQQQYPKHKRNR